MHLAYDPRRTVKAVLARRLHPLVDAISPEQAMFLLCNFNAARIRSLFHILDHFGHITH